jgi:hypothetical protein
MSDVTATSKHKIIRTPDLLSPLKQTAAKMAANKAGSTRYQSSHKLKTIP